MRKCPYCAEEIQEEAILCRFCKSDLLQKKQLSQIEITGKSSVKDGVRLGAGMFIVLPLIIAGIILGLILIFLVFALMGQATQSLPLALLVIGIGIFVWGVNEFGKGQKASKRAKKNKAKDYQVPVEINMGIWICPKCNSTNEDVLEFCAECQQAVLKNH